MSEVECIVSIDGESYTYNAKNDRLVPIQERGMILKAIASGVSVERLAAVLKMDVRAIRSELNVTSRLDSEVVELLRNTLHGRVGCEN